MFSLLQAVLKDIYIENFDTILKLDQIYYAR